MQVNSLISFLIYNSLWDRQAGQGLSSQPESVEPELGTDLSTAGLTLVLGRAGAGSSVSDSRRVHEVQPLGGRIADRLHLFTPNQAFLLFCFAEILIALL